ncbi:MAG: hypothetical protein ABSH22_14035, partial [Tepidisphaeraceae bacterium]
MSDSTPTPRPSLSEISHLFLTELRQRQTNGAARPTRKPPSVSHAESPAVSAVEPPAVSAVEPPAVSNAEPPVVNNVDQPATDLSEPPIVENNIMAPTGRTISLVVAHHLGASASTRVLEFAQHSAAAGPVALIELADEGLRITTLDASNPDEESAVQPSDEPVSYKTISHALEEMSWDIQHWLVFLPNPRSNAAPELLAQIDQWTLLVTAADDTIVGGYRALKGLLTDSARPSISVAVAGAEDDAQADLIHRKLDRATRQFLDVSLLNQGRVTSAPDAQTHVALCCRCTDGVTQEHWNAVTAWTISSSAAPDAQPGDSTATVSVDSVEPPAATAVESPAMSAVESPAASTIEPPVVSNVEPIVTESIPEPIPMKLIQPTPSKSSASFDEILDLSGSADSADILSAILKHHTDWIAAPVAPPAHESAKIAVEREGRLILVAVADGLYELPAISRAYTWLTENRPLLRMAFPQLSIDAAAMPRLTLF